MTSSNKLFSLDNLSRIDVNILKGLSIICIVAHNFFHQIHPSPGENEFFFNKNAFFNTLIQVWNNPLDILNPLFCFFGHYGVYIFIFLSGYGLTKKVRSLNIISYKNLYISVAFQILKLVKLTLLGCLVIILYRKLIHQDYSGYKFLFDYLKLFTLTNNLRSDQLFTFISVWWFIVLITQLYIIFPVVYKFSIKDAPYMLIASCICIFLASFIYQPLLNEKIFVFATPLGQIAIFSLGIYLALGNTIPLTLIRVSILLLPFSFFIEFLYPFSFILVTMSVLYTYIIYRQQLVGYRSLEHIGCISMYIFIIHGDLRWILVKIANEQHITLINYLLFCGYAIEVYILAYALHAIADYIGLFTFDRRILRKQLKRIN